MRLVERNKTVVQKNRVGRSAGQRLKLAETETHSRSYYCTQLYFTINMAVEEHCLQFVY